MINTRKGVITELHSFIIEMLISLCPDEEPLVVLMVELNSYDVVGLKRKRRGLEEAYTLCRKTE